MTWNTYYIILSVIMALFGLFGFRRAGRILKFLGYSPKSPAGIAVRLLSAVLFAAMGYNPRLTSIRFIVALHIILIFALTDLAAFLVEKIHGLGLIAGGSGRLYNGFRFIARTGILPLVIVALLFAYGHYNMNRVTRTYYELSSDRIREPFTLLLISDAHYGTVQDPKVLTEAIPRMSAEEPDVVILGGDIVDDWTSAEDMKKVFAGLGGIKSKYGIYYVYGNHDRQRYSNDSKYTAEELAETIGANGITVLQDKVVRLREDVVLAGREDASFRRRAGRLALSEILSAGLAEDAGGSGTFDPDRDYLIVADHQPIEAEEDAAAGADLLVSGHTHSGQFWPGRFLLERFGTMAYGHYEVNGMDAVVTSGFAGWGYPFRTQGHCEYVVIRILPR